MSTDSMPIPSWAEVQAALDAQQRRQNQQRREQSTINWLRGAGAAMMALGLITGIVLLVAWLSNHETDQLRHAVNPYATMLTLGGLIVFGIGVIRAALRRDRETIVAKIANVDRRYRAYRPHDAEGDRDAEWQHDVAEAYRLGQQNPRPNTD